MAGLPQIPQVQTTSRTDNQSQQNIISGVIHLLRSPLALTSYLQTVSLSSGSNTIAHKLGQTPQGYIITKRNGTATVYDTSMDAVYLTLTASASLTCDILVF